MLGIKKQASLQQNNQMMLYNTDPMWDHNN